MVSSKFFQNVKEEQILTSYNFARNSDFIYSEELTHQQYSKIKNENHVIVTNDYRIIYINPHIELKENSVIFCHTNFIKYLFESLEKCINLKNLKLITHQTDIPIDKKIYSLKPDCISEWYSINIQHSSPSLKPIPLGLSNNYSPKNLFFKDYKKKDLKNEKKINLIYTNFSENTNSKIRTPIVKHAKRNENFYVEEKKIDLDKYLDQLISFQYVICPEGNGIDTHRVWETLYSGSIPIVKEHPTFRTLDNLPAFVLEDFMNVSVDELEIKKSNFQDFNFNKLKIEYWLNKIRSKNINSNEVFKFIEKKEKTISNIKTYKSRIKFQRNLKKIRYYFSFSKKLSKMFKL